jgi:glycosyltransferase involved in cell wall biosynthesis
MVWHIAHDNDVSPGKHTLGQGIESMCIDKPLVEYGLRNAGCIVAQTERQAELLRNNYGGQCNAVIPNFHPDPQEPIEKGSTIKVVWVANLKEWKRPEVFVQLAGDLKALDNLEFIMVGAPPTGKSEWRNKLIRDIDKTANLNYLGQLGQDEVNQVLAHSHIFVNTSLAEGFANTFIQAWMRRVPVVSLHVNPDRVFDTHEIGFYCETYERLINNVRHLIENERLREKMGNEAQRYAFERHSMRNAQTLMQLFDSC